MDTAEVPAFLIPHLMHGFLQYVADETGADILHIKGPALHPDLLQRDPDGRPVARRSSDADVLVRPQHAQAFVAGLLSHGCQQWSTFESGSPFEHAANFTSDNYGGADVHRFFPGLSTRPGRVFEALWGDRQTAEIGHRAVCTPSLADQRLILLLHSARAGTPDHPDKLRAWDAADDPTRSAVRTRARELGATVGLAAAIGELDRHRGDPAYLLWDLFSRRPDHSRTEEWVARLRAARTPRQIASVLRRSVSVNVDHLAIALGRQPTRQEIRRAWVSRFTRALSERRTGHGEQP